MKICGDLCLRFPNIAEAIFDELDYQSLVKCKEVDRQWSNFLKGKELKLFGMLLSENILVIRLSQNRSGNHCSIREFQLLDHCPI